jgi:fibronectin-binding autotransporter adhesin
MSRRRLSRLWALTLLVPAARAVANTVTWANPASGVFSANGNWVGNVAPGSADTAFFNTGSSLGYTVSFIVSATATNLTIANDHNTFDLAGKTLGVTNVNIGASAGDSVTLKSSSGSGTLAASSQLFLGNSAGDIGTFNVTGAGAFFTAGTLNAGFSGTSGTMNIQNGASVSANTMHIGLLSGVTGTVTVDGAGSNCTVQGALDVADGQLGATTGTLTVQNGATFMAKGGINIGFNAGATGSVIVTGASSTLDIFAQLTVGGGNSAGGMGTLNIQSGNVLIQNFPLKIWNTTGTGVSFSGGSLTASTIDASGNPARFTWTGGNLTLTTAAALPIDAGNLLGANPVIEPNMALHLTDSGANILIGDQLTAGASANVSLTVNGSSVSTAGELHVGDFNNGETSFTVPVNASLTVENGGTLSDNFARLGKGSLFNVNATVDGAGSSWTTTQLLTVGQASAAILNIQNGGSLSAGAIDVGDGSAGTVNITGAASILTTPSLNIGGSGGASISLGILNIESGTVSVSGTLKIWNNSGTRVNLSGGTLSVAALDVSGNLNDFNWTGGTLNFTTGPLNIGSAGGPLSASVTLNSGMTLSLTGSNSNVVVGTGGSLFLSGGMLQAGSLNTTASTSGLQHWTSGTIDLINSSLTLGSTSPVGPVIVLNAGMTLRVSGAGQSFAVGSTGAFEIAGGTLFGHSIDLTQGTVAFSAGAIQIDTGTLAVGGSSNTTYAGTILGNGSLAKSGANTLTLNGPFSYTGPTTVSGGKLVLGSSLTTSSAISIATGTTLALAQGGNEVLSTPSVTLAGTGALDLADNDMILPYVSTSPLLSVRNLIKGGYNNGHWNGQGIQSSVAAKNASANTALGYGDAADLGITSLDGQPITGNAVVIKYTYYGDSSLDGKVDLGNDFNLFLQGYLGKGSGWEFGDYNFDTATNVTDFQMFIDGFKSQSGNLGSLDAVIAASSDLTESQKAQFLSFVPEPASALLLSTAACIFAMRPRRRCESPVILHLRCGPSAPPAN